MPAFKVGDRVEVVGKINKNWGSYVAELDEMVGRSGTITYINDYSTGVDFGNERWNFPTSTLRHAKAETSQPTPTEQLRAIAQAETAFNTCSKIDRMVIHGQLVAAQSNADFPAILAHVEAMEERAERAEHFARVVSGLRGSMSKSEVSLLVETAQITLLFPTEKAGEA